MQFLIDFEPIGRRGECQSGDSVLECARSLGIDLVNICGGAGSCGSCLVQVLEGSVSPITELERTHISADRLREGYRLACLTIPLSDCKLCVPEESLTSPQRLQIEGQDLRVSPDPTVKVCAIKLSPASLTDQFADAERVSRQLVVDYGLYTERLDYPLLCELSTALRENNWQLNVVVSNKEIIATYPIERSVLGVAVDLGTTKMAVYLLDLVTGESLASKGIMNPQIAYGEDIITRISIAQKDAQMRFRLQSLLIEDLNKAVSELCTACNQQTDQIVDCVLVGNTAMHHLFLGLPVRQLGRAPYVPAVCSALDVKARDLGLKFSPGAYVHLLPNIAGYVGADHVAMLLGAGIFQKTGVVLAIDIGTNTEICLAVHGELTSLSTASGPAFEGAHIKYGMRAATGAIERFQIIGGTNKYQTIDNAPPTGLCGSGILDILAALRKEGIVDERGKIKKHPFVSGVGIDSKYLIASNAKNGGEICITQKDIEQIQLAKGAIRTGIDILMSQQGIAADDIDEVIIAGAFGTYLNVDSAISIGLLPEILSSKVRQVGNAAGVGAKQALISAAKRCEAEAFAEKIRYIELSGYPDFVRFFAKALRM